MLSCWIGQLWDMVAERVTRKLLGSLLTTCGISYRYLFVDCNSSRFIAINWTVYLCFFISDKPIYIQLNLSFIYKYNISCFSVHCEKYKKKQIEKMGKIRDIIRLTSKGNNKERVDQYFVVEHEYCWGAPWVGWNIDI